MQLSQMPPHDQIMSILLGQAHSRALCLATELGLADILAEGPLQVEELARRSGTNADALYRLLRALESLGVFSENSPSVFENSPASECLRKSITGSQRSSILAHLHKGYGQFEAWAELEHSIRTGQPSFEKVYGYDVWEFGRRNREASAHLNESMRAISVGMTPTATAALDWSQFPLIADVGGGIGTQLVPILNASPSSKGILFDQAHTVAEALQHDRMTVISGDFFVSVPEGADAYVLRWIIHDWSDAQAKSIMETVRRYCKPSARLILIEMIIQEGAQFDFSKWTDLQMLVVLGGRERTAAEFDTLLSAAGFRLEELRDTSTSMRLLIAKPV